MLNLKNFYSNNTKLIYSATTLTKFFNIYKRNYDKVKNFDELISKFPKDLHPLFKSEIEKQYNDNEAIQSGLFTELSVLATLAKMYKMPNFMWQNHGYIYENDNWRFILQGNMGHGNTGLSEGNDLLITDKEKNITYNCEIKQPIARLNERDVKYDENGKLIIREDLEDTQYIEIINYFNNNFNVFETIGHNTPIPEQYVDKIIDDYFSTVDYIFTYIRGYMVIIPNNKELIDTIYDKTVSEIRTLNGKNSRVIFTPIYAKTVLDKYLIKEDDNYYYFNKNDFEYRPGRGTEAKGRYVLKEGFFIEGKYVFFKDNILYCKKNNYKQNCPLISPKAKLKPTYSELKRILLQGGYNIDK